MNFELMKRMGLPALGMSVPFATGEGLVGSDPRDTPPRHTLTQVQV